jgi:fructosamine-3-kinase
MILPKILATHLEASLGPIIEAVPVSGGDISQAARVKLAGGAQLLVKWHSSSPSGLFTAEQRGLELLRAVGTLRVPKVVAHREAVAGCPAFIAIEWLDLGAKSGQSAEALGTGLAAQHRVLAPSFGLDHSNFIGAKGLLPGDRSRRLEVLLARLGDWLPVQPPASLLHGDLWGGNWLVTTSGEPVLIDPAVYYGHREADLAFTELFGGFPATFYAAYQASWPLDNGYKERKDLYNLYHLLNHLNLFGESYGGSVDSILQRYGR